MIVLADSSIERLQIVADILVKSVVLEHYEATIAETFDRIETMAQELQRSGIGWKSGRELVRHFGTAESLLDLLQNYRFLRVEWNIVILIVVEILLTL